MCCFVGILIDASVPGLIEFASDMSAAMTGGWTYTLIHRRHHVFVDVQGPAVDEVVQLEIDDRSAHHVVELVRRSDRDTSIIVGVSYDAYRAIDVRSKVPRPVEEGTVGDERFDAGDGVAIDMQI